MEKRASLPVKQVCLYCTEKREVDFKDINSIRKFVTDRGRILAKDRTGLCAGHQRQVALAIKYARHLALIPFIVRV